MKNLNILSRLSAGVLFLALASCSTEDEISSKVTYFPVITQNSPDQEVIFVEEGTAFTDPGAVATVDDVEVPMETTYEGWFRGNSFTGTLDTNVSDIYTVEYSAVNEDGFTGVSTRQVIVAETGDLVTSISGLYRSSVARNGSITPQYEDMEYVLIWQNADGTFEISDAFGGYYDIGRVYGLTYITPGAVIEANDIPSNDFTLPTGLSNISFGGSADITSMTVDPDAKTIDFVCVWEADPATTYTFEVHLEQVQF